MVTGEHGGSDVLALLSEIRSDTSLIGAAVAAAQSEGGPNGSLPETEIGRHVDVILNSVYAVASGDLALMASANAEADDLAVDRFQQGVDLEAVLQGFRLGRSVIVERFVEIGHQRLGTERLLSLLAPMDAVVGTVQERMILTYAAAEREAIRSRRNLRMEALRALLSGGSLDWASEAGLDPQKDYYCLVADVSVPKQARRLEDSWLTSGGVAGIAHGSLCNVTPHLPLQEVTDHRIVVSPRVPVCDLASTFRLCQQALTVCRSNGISGTVPLLKVAHQVAITGQPLLGKLVTADLLGNLDRADEFHHELAVSMQAYIACGRNTEVAAQALHVHANTLRYRIRRFEHLNTSALGPTGADDSLAFDIRMWWALTTWLSEERKR